MIKMMRKQAWHKRAASFAAVAGLYLAFPSLGAEEPARAVVNSMGTQPALSHAETEGIIFERQQVMLQLNRDAELLGNIVAGLAPAEKLAATTAAIAQGAKDSIANYGDKVPGGRAKPEVWSNYADFMQRMQTFSRNADAMAEMGKSGNVGGVTEQMVGALPCKQCHDIYRAPKTS